MLTDCKIVVTGGAGFIGSHLCDILVAADNHVIIIDDLSTGRLKNIEHPLSPSPSMGEELKEVERTTYRVKPKTSNSQSVILAPNTKSGEGSQDGSTIHNPQPTFHNSPLVKNSPPIIHKSKPDFIQGSITNLTLLQEMFKGVDYVFHEAAIPSVSHSIENPAAAHEVNATGTLNVLLAARDNKVKKVVFASSCAVYGDNPDLPLREDALPRPLSPYAVGKLTGEYYCRIFQNVYGLNTICLRYFNVYGPRQNSDSEYAAVIPKFIKRVVEGQPPIIFGDGEQTRDFVFVKDVAAANILAAENAATGIFNIGTGRSITLNQLAKTIIDLSGIHLQPIYISAKPGDIRFSLAAVSEAKRFGYLSKYNLEGGLSKMVSNKNGEYIIE
jgi:UDP-glucose 4-epimerase